MPGASAARPSGLSRHQKPVRVPQHSEAVQPAHRVDCVRPGPVAREARADRPTDLFGAARPVHPQGKEWRAAKSLGNPKAAEQVGRAGSTTGPGESDEGPRPASPKL